MDLKPIETVYKGYRFRSRLEARWAVFFDAMGWEWVYEDQGYELPAGRYLPDFYVRSDDCFFEIKPETVEPEQLERTYRLCGQLAMAAQKDVILVFGDPFSCIASSNWDVYGPPRPMSLFTSKLTDGAIEARMAAIKARQARFEHGAVGAPA